MRAAGLSVSAIAQTGRRHHANGLPDHQGHVAMTRTNTLPVLAPLCQTVDRLDGEAQTGRPDGDEEQGQGGIPEGECMKLGSPWPLKKGWSAKQPFLVVNPC